MAQEGGTSVIKIKSVGQSNTGKNWAVESLEGTGNGRKFNLPKKNFKEMPRFDLEKTYYFHWNWFDVPNTQNSMRIVNEFREAGPEDKETDSRQDGGVQKEPTVQKPTVVVPGPSPKPAIEGWRTGQALNAGILMAGYSGKKPDDADWWPCVFFYADQTVQASYTYEKGVGTFGSKF